MVFGKTKTKGKSAKELRDAELGEIFDEETEVRPRGFTPSEVKPWKLRVISFSARWGGILGILAIVLQVYALANPIEPDPAPEPPSLASDAKPVATRTVGEWLSASPQPVPDGRVLSWDGFDEVQMPTIDTEDMTEDEVEEAKFSYSLEVHNFTVIDKNNILYTVAVQVADDKSAGPHVIGSPSLIPDPIPATNFQMDDPWPEMPGQSLPPSTDTAINTWAEAFTSGRPDDLRQVVSDPENAHSYTPLYKVKEFEVTVEDSAYFQRDVEDSSETENNPNRALARVNLVLHWEGQSVPEESTEATISYDLLIEDVESASPRVVAWGAPGKGPQMKAFDNAIIGRGPIEDPTVNNDDPTQAPTQGAQEPSDPKSDPKKKD